MKNEYYTNRHYIDTDKIRIAVNNMNKDMRELSEYCDKLEILINKVIKYIKEHCVDGEFYINLSDKEKGIIDVLTMLENGVDESE